MSGVGDRTEDEWSFVKSIWSYVKSIWYFLKNADWFDCDTFQEMSYLK